MVLFGEIVVEILMIAALVVAIISLARLLRLCALEHIYLQQLRRRRLTTAGLIRIPAPAPEPEPASQEHVTTRDPRVVLREKHV